MFLRYDDLMSVAWTKHLEMLPGGCPLDGGVRRLNCYARVHIELENGEVVISPLPKFEGADRVLHRIGFLGWTGISEKKIHFQAPSGPKDSMCHKFVIMDAFPGRSEETYEAVMLVFSNQICWLHDYGKHLNGRPIRGIEVFVIKHKDELEALRQMHGVDDSMVAQQMDRWQKNQAALRYDRDIEQAALWPNGRHPQRVIFEGDAVAKCPGTIGITALLGG